MKVFVAALIGSSVLGAEAQQLDAVISGVEAESSAVKVDARNRSGPLEKQPRFFNMKESVVGALFGDSDSDEPLPTTIALSPRPHRPLARPDRPYVGLISRPSRLTTTIVDPEFGITPVDPIDPNMPIEPSEPHHPADSVDPLLPEPIPPVDIPPVDPFFPWSPVPIRPIKPARPPVPNPKPIPPVDPFFPWSPVPITPTKPAQFPEPSPKPIPPIDPVLPMPPVPLPVLPDLPQEDHIHIGNNYYNINMNGKQNVGSGKVTDGEGYYRPPAFPVMPIASFYPARPEFESHSDGGQGFQPPPRHHHTAVVGLGAPK